MGYSLHKVHLSTRDTTDGSVPVVPNPHVQVPGVKVLEVLIEGNKILQGQYERVNDFCKSCLGISLYSDGPSLFCGSQGKQSMITAKPDKTKSDRLATL